MKKLILILAMLGSSAHAQFVDGNELLRRMKQDGVWRSFATGYVVGIHDSMSLSNHVCSPENATSGQVRDVVQAWLEANPVIRDRNGALLVAAALRAVWPCASKGSQL